MKTKCVILVLCFFAFNNLYSQSMEFDRTEWEKDKFGKLGIRSKMKLPVKITEDYLISSKENAYNNLIEVYGYPDKFCVSNSKIALIWYYEGYMYPEYFEQKNFVGKYCNERLNVSISSLVFKFDCDGNYISSAMIKKGG